MKLQTNIYDFECYFAIIVGYDRLSVIGTIGNTFREILEPKGWQSPELNLHTPRNKQDFGFTSDFIDDKIGMTFTYAVGKTTPKGKNITGGAEILYNLYETIGCDAIAYFQFGEKDGNTYLPFYSGKINLNVYQRDFGGVITSVEKLPFQATILGRQGADVTLNSMLNFDKQLLSPIETYTVRLHSQVLQETTNSQTVGPLQSNLISDNVNIINGQMDPNPPYENMVAQYILQPDTTNTSLSELSNFVQAPMGVVKLDVLRNGDTGYTDIYKLELFQYQAVNGGSLNILYSGSCKVYFYKYDSESFIMTPEIVQYGYNEDGSFTQKNIFQGIAFSSVATPNVVAPSYVLNPSVTGGDRVNISATNTFNWSLNQQNIQVSPLDQFYIHIKMTWGANSGTLNQMEVDNYQNTIILTQATLAPSTSATGYRIFDVLQQMIECCTNQKLSLKSNFFSKGGAGYNYLLANGFSIRNFGGPSYNFRMSLSSAIKSLQAIFGLGRGYATIEGKEYMILEPISSFMNKNVIYTFHDTFLWMDQHSDDFVFNQAILGYNTYALDQLEMLYAFCTTATYLFQTTRTNANVFQAQSDIIADGNTLEFCRRNQFLQNQSQDTTYDNNIFIIATLPEANDTVYTDDITITLNSDGFVPGGGNVQIGFTKIMSLIPGDVITITNGIFTGVQFIIYCETPGYPYIDGTDSYVFTFISTLNGSELIPGTTFTITPTNIETVFAESNQPFLPDGVCINVPYPNTIYNARLSVKHLEFNWSPLLSVGLYWVEKQNNPDDNFNQIWTTSSRNNSLFTTRFDESEPNKLFVGTQTIRELDNVLNFQYNNPNGLGGLPVTNNAIFTPKGATFQAKIGWNNYNILKNALCMETGDVNLDGGGIVAKDDLSQYWFCQVMDIRYDLVKQIATLQVQKVNQVFLT